MNLDWGKGGQGTGTGSKAWSLLYHRVGYRGTFHGSGLWEGLLKKVVSFMNNSMKENVNILHFKTLSENSFYIKLGHILQVYQ